MPSGGDPSVGRRPLVVLTDVSDLDPAPALALLEEAGFDVEVLQLDADPVVPERARRAVAAVGGYARLDEGFFSALPDLRFVALSSAGADMVDLAAARRHGVEIRPLLGVATEEVAVHALGLILAVERGLRIHEAVAAGAWSEAFTALPRRLSGCTLGLLGTGRIGAELARLAGPVFGRVVGFDRGHARGDVPAGLTPLASVAQVLRASDVLSIHLPLTDDTRGMLGTDELALLPRGASLVNVSRAEIVVADALVAALDSGRLRGAGLDVLCGEPPAADDPLRSHPAAVVTPHVGYLSDRSLASYQEDPTRTVIAWWRGTGGPQA
jgi:D-3-phosphoglycerate dehydrogenase